MIKLASLLAESTIGGDTRYVGNVDVYGSIRLPQGQNGHAFHNHYGWENSQGKFAYWPLMKKVSWWDKPDEDTAMRVEDFLKRRGFDVKYHCDAIGSKLMDPLLTEGMALDRINAEIKALEDEWEMLDSQGTGFARQSHINRELQMLHMQKKKWDDLYAATNIPPTPVEESSLHPDVLLGAINASHEVEVVKGDNENARHPFKYNTWLKWRYVPEIQYLSWWEKPDEMEDLMVRDYLERHGYKVKLVNIMTMREGVEVSKRPNKYGLGQLGQYDEIEFVWVPSVEHHGTQHSDKFRNPSYRRFRFYFLDDDKHGLVYWVTSPTTQEDTQRVEDFFAKRGIEIDQRDKKLDQLTEGVIMEEVTQEQATATLDFLKQMVRKGPFKGKVYLAGGAVRDMIRGEVPKDLDVVVTDNGMEGGMKFATWLAQEMGNFKQGSNPVLFPTFGTANVVLNGQHNGVNLNGMDVQAVFARKEVYTPGSRKPEVFPGTIQDDAFRRDFTVNSLMLDLTTDQILDITGRGKDDIAAGIIQTTSNADEIFGQDALRMFRAIRFATKYKWKIDPKTWEGIKKNLDNLSNTSMERVRDELNKILLTADPAYGMRLLRDSGLLPHVAPELQQAVGMTQNVHHVHDVFDHTLEVLKNTNPELLQRLMALFHDIGKVATRSETPSGVHFYGHERVGEEVVDKILRNLKYPLEIINAVKLGVKNHMRLKQGGKDGAQLTDKTLRKFKMELGDNLEHLLNVIHADNIAHADASAMPDQIKNVRQRLNALNVQVKKPVLPINGEDLKALGVPPGPLFGKILSAVTDAWFENPNISKEESIAIVQRMV